MTDSIPRLHRIVDHARDQLRGIAQGAAKFEDCRIRYGHTQERLVREGRGRLTASRFAEDERNWAPTRDCLSELMRWGAVVPGELPSARVFLPRYRHVPYELTDMGRELAEFAQLDGMAFVDAVAERIIAAHPHVQTLLRSLSSGPIICPAVSEGDIERGRQERFGTAGWGRWGAERIKDGTTAETVTATIREHLDRRFGKPPVDRPTNKALAEATNDALAVAGFAARGLQTDAATIKTLLRWGSELLLFDQSRYVPWWPDCNTIWLAADIETLPDGPIRAARRGLGNNGERVARSLVQAYRSQAEKSDSSLAAPYLAIYRVRAQSAFECDVTRALVDLVLSGLAEGKYPGLGITVFLHIGTSMLPISEPAFRHHGRRRLELTMTNTTRKEDT